MYEVRKSSYRAETLSTLAAPHQGCLRRSRRADSIAAEGCVLPRVLRVGARCAAAGAAGGGATRKSLFRGYTTVTPHLLWELRQSGLRASVTACKEVSRCLISDSSGISRFPHTKFKKESKFRHQNKQKSAV